MPRTLSSSSAALTVFGALFALGALLFIAGTVIVRSSHRGVEPSLRAPLRWTREIGDGAVFDAETRVDMIERLALVGEPWCVATLQSALGEEKDPIVRDAAENALIVVGARSN